MLFPTITFAIFFMVVLLTSWLLIRRRLDWQLFMIAASYYFYAYYDWRFAFLLAGSTVANWIVGRQIYRSDNDTTRRLWLVLGVVVNLGALGYFKYEEFFLSSATNLLHTLGIGVSPTIVSVALPIGIS
ncbi:MAG TPA: MBOAT family protein, partial [Acidimicrobiia bacterium]